MVATPQAALAMRDDDPAVVHDVAITGDAGLALQHGRPQQRVPLLALPPSISICPEQSASNVANTMARDILNPDGEGRKDDIPQGKVGVDDLAQHILDNKAKHKKKIIKKRPAASDHTEQPSKKHISKPTRDSNGLTIPFPGVPKKACPPIAYKSFRIYTDLKTQAWRVKKVGERKDKAASWNANPQEAWNKVLGFLKA